MRTKLLRGGTEKNFRQRWRRWFAGFGIAVATGFIVLNVLAYPTNSPLINAGSQTAAGAGLAFYTVVTNNTIDGANMVSIGFHYLDAGVGANGEPVADSLPDSWQLEYFGVVGIDTNADFDGTGVSIAYDQANGMDPNVVNFDLFVSNSWLNTTNLTIPLAPIAGVPFYMATLLDQTNFSTASWIPYNSNLYVNLGAVQGWHMVWVGLRGFPANSQQTWNRTRVKLDLTPPALVVTNPGTSLVTSPYIQIQGYSPEELASIYYDLSNSNGLQTNQPAFVNVRQFDTNVFDYTTNGFQCFSVPLVVGTNTITLHATDLAGNLTTTNFVYNFDPAANTNPPQINLMWPQDGMYVSGTSLTIRGTVSDAFATIGAQVVNNGTTNWVNGAVEQNNSFWVYNVPLGEGLNYVAVSATNAAGYENLTNFTVVQSAVTLAITSADLFNGTVSGSISDGSYSVTVNGVLATLTDSTNWTASGVPPATTGTSVVSVGATSTEGGAETPVETEMEIANAGGGNFSTFNGTEQSSSGGSFFSETENWTFGSPGSDNTVYCYQNPTQYEVMQWPWNSGGIGTLEWQSGTNCGVVNDSGSYPANLYPNSGDWRCLMSPNDCGDTPAVEYYDAGSGGSFYRHVQSTCALQTGGSSTTPGLSVWFLYAQGWSETPENFTSRPYQTQLSPVQLTMAGQPMSDTGQGVGALAMALPNDVTVDDTPKGPGNYQATTAVSGPFSLASYTACGTPADPRNTNQSRTTIGIGEQVLCSLGGGEPYPVQWSVTGNGTLSGGNGNGTLLTAGMSPGSVTVSAKIINGGGYPYLKSLDGLPPQKITFTVVAPSGIGNVSLNTDLGWGDSGYNFIGANTLFNIQVLPTSVNFANAKLREDIPQSPYRTWPNSNVSYTAANIIMFTNQPCWSANGDHISDGPFPIGRLFNGTNYVDFSYPKTWTDEYLNAESNWVPFMNMSTLTEFRGSDQACRETYLGTPGNWEGPWQ